ncbi:hypothetical protein EN850_02965 [Mesorhizobium sp. M8A.F.Ca.ET.207.01.1.1]|uniref:hypothetical protein n=1 Tax=Mesorhizobium sp. M8A.F.Ca.ET.207.01.1.1 TaxID=2563968 RepID=UPI00109D1583|nr:hypothetical protein [Mesorhizobium sp. M8A.F.Ca.ET.207.01.1.1]TGQ83719.1 hypothetical protein EN850_02965 [Mesorhizobium sp. M8A.F.Ca.ET.207.01.1.1]
MNTEQRRELAKLKGRLQALREDIDLFGEDLSSFVDKHVADDEDTVEALDEIVSSLGEHVTKIDELLGQDEGL